MNKPNKFHIRHVIHSIKHLVIAKFTLMLPNVNIKFIDTNQDTVGTYRAHIVNLGLDATFRHFGPSFLR